MAAKRKIAFVLPWYGVDIAGGAENGCRSLAHAVATYCPEFEVEVLTTTLREFTADWNTPAHAEGVSSDGQVVVRRFHANHRLRRLFFLYARLLQMFSKPTEKNTTPVPRFIEWLYMRYMVHSDALYAYLRRACDSYEAFIYTPYMFGITTTGPRITAGKSMLIPALHDEPQAYLRPVRAAFAAAKGYFFYSRAEMELALRLYALSPGACTLLGGVIDPPPAIVAAGCFQRKFSVARPYLLYVGRLVAGKNLEFLINIFREAQARHAELRELELLLIGKGDFTFDAQQFPNVRILGFLSASEKMEALAGAVALVQPSEMESFSIVIMESWQAERPVLVNERCAAPRGFVEACQGGFLFGDAPSFADGVSKILRDPAAARGMGERGRKFVEEQFSARAVAQRFAIGLSAGPDSVG